MIRLQLINRIIISLIRTKFSPTTRLRRRRTSWRPKTRRTWWPSRPIRLPARFLHRNICSILNSRCWSPFLEQAWALTGSRPCPSTPAWLRPLWPGLHNRPILKSRRVSFSQICSCDSKWSYCSVWTKKISLRRNVWVFQKLFKLFNETFIMKSYSNIITI